MATTVASFSAIDDTEVDADSPITESLVTRLRDNSYWVDPASTKTAETDTSLVLKPDGSGSTVWGEAGVDGTKGTVDTNAGSTTWTTLTTKTSGIFKARFISPASSGDLYYDTDIVVDLSDDSFQSLEIHDDGTPSTTVRSGTITTGSAVSSHYNNASTGFTFNLRRDSGNFQYQASSGANGRFRLCWVIL